MPNKHAAIKDLRKNERRALRNARLKMHVKSLSKQLKELVKEGKKTEVVALSSKLQQAADKAAKNHVLPVNKVRRMKSATHKLIATTK
ncbi:30S ribosomal protein S20 [Candidatus Uhrbacteria bacterium]|nr:30S ribosomal protein S20 [Candidatus Uhrbacteria bacterium]